MTTSFEILAYQTRTVDFAIAIYAADGTTPIALTPSDAVRVKIGRGCGTPLLDILSGTPTANESSITINDRGNTDDGTAAQVTLHLAQADLAALPASPYEIEIIVVDTSDTAPENAVKRVQFGVLQVIGTMDGNVGLS